MEKNESQSDPEYIIKKTGEEVDVSLSTKFGLHWFAELRMVFVGCTEWFAYN